MKQKTAQGFTLIELLIVIAVLGILAVAVLSAINPIEQINRSRDTGSRSDAEQLIGAIDRFYATQGYYPWLTAPCTGALCEATPWTTVSTWTDGSLLVLSKLSESGSGELKASFTTRISGATYNPLHSFNRGQTGDSTYVCFSPKSSAFKVEAATRCTAAAGLPTDYPTTEACPATCAVATPDTCFSCLP
jgi:prepilin-type N-terminal cleavage/methylation domain-containing protein